jgi:hypothetical protein
VFDVVFLRTAKALKKLKDESKKCLISGVECPNKGYLKDITSTIF